MKEASGFSGLIVASASPRRQEILRKAGIDFVVATSEAEAQLRVQGRPQAVARAGARAKALDVAARFAEGIVLGADTVVAVGRQVLGKPANAAEAEAMLRMLSGRVHNVHTALALVEAGSGRILAESCETSLVRFHVLDDKIIKDYVASGDPLDKAGAYGIQSGAGLFVAELIGSYLNVVGLPLARLWEMLAKLGWQGL